MEVDFAKEHTVSYSTCPPTESAPPEQMLTNNEQAANDCDHFTIRGYVAEARGNDIKLCWPFSMLHGCNGLYKDADLLPPYRATKFRRWDCQNCQARIPSPKSVLDGTIRNTSNDKLELLEISLATSHPDANKNSSEFREISEEMIEEGSTKAERSICPPSQHFSKNENASAVAVINKEVGETTKDGNIESEENQKQSTDYAFDPIEREANQMDNGVNATTSENVPGENDSNMRYIESEDGSISAVAVIIKEVCQTIIDGNIESEENQKQSTEYAFDPIEREAYQMGEHDERGNGVNATTSENVGGENDSNMRYIESEDGNISAVAVINKGVGQTIKDGNIESEENQKQSTEYAFDPTEREAYQTREHDEIDNGVYATTSENVPGENDSNMTSVKPKEIHENLGAEIEELDASKTLKDNKELSGAGKKESSDIVTKGYKIPVRVCLDIQNDDAVTAIVAKAPDNNPIELEAYQMGEHDDIDNAVNATTSENVPGENDSNMTSVKLKEIPENLGAEIEELVASKTLKDDKELSGAGKIKESSDIVTEGYKIPARVCLDIQNDNAVTAIVAKAPDNNSMGLDRDNQGVPDSHMRLKDVMAQIQSNSIHKKKSTGKLHSRRARKMRKLDDILRNEKVCKYDKGNVLGGDAEVRKKSSDNKQDALEKRARDLDTEVQLVHQKIAVNLGKRKFRNEVPREDGDHSRMHWLKKAPIQTIGRNKDLESNCADSAAGLSKFAADVSTWKDMHHEFDYRTPKEYKKNIISGGEKNMMTRVMAWPTSSKDNMVGNGFNREDPSTKHLNHKDAPFAPIKATIPKRRLPRVLDNTMQANNMSNNNNKIVQVVERQPGRMNWSKESLSMNDPSGSQLHTKVTKKPRTMRSSAQQPMDDIPMDIVELLARNLQEKRMMNAAGVTKNMWNSSEAADSTTDHYSTDIMNSSRNKGSHAIFGSHSKQHSHSNAVRNSVHYTVKNNNSDPELKASHHLSIGKQNHCVDPYQREQISASSRFVAFSEYDRTSGMQVPKRAAQQDLNQAGPRTEDGALQHWRSNNTTQTCAINRNPADFTTLDDGDYTRRPEDRRHGYVPTS